MQFGIADERDFPSILDLQQLNLFENLSPEDRASGFLSVQFDEPTLHEVINDIGIIKAYTEHELAGYFMAQSLEFNARFPLVAAIIERFPSIAFKNKSIAERESFIAGPICVAKKWRGKNVPRGMFEALLPVVKENFEVGVTFASVLNTRSLAVLEHKLGMSVVDHIDFNGKRFSIMAFELR